LKKPVTLRLYQRSQTASALRTAACDPFIFRLPILVFKTEQSLKSWLFAIVIAGMNQ
jgi:FMN-dependent NADH-azoreductase